MSEYLKFRQNKCNNDLFIHLNGKSLTRYQFNATMTKSLKFIKSEGHFRSHSFRIGGTTHLANLGKVESEIMKAGRWQFQVYSKYIRL